MIVVLSGSLRLARQVPDGRSVDVHPVQAGDVWGVVSCVDGAPRSTAASSRTASVIAELPRSAVSDLLDARTAAALTFQVGVCRSLFAQVRMTNRRVAELAVVPESEVEPASLLPV